MHRTNWNLHSNWDSGSVRSFHIVLSSFAFSLLVGGAAPALPPLPVTTVVIDSDHGPVSFKVEVAGDAATQERGLMFRTKMAANAGMLFDFHRPQTETFWMKNTVLSLDLIFIRDDGSISSIAPNAVPYSESLVPSAEPVRAVLEINGGRAAALGIEPDQHVHNAIFGNALPGQK
jgi:uncharacterized membrane protein (UPF0127 family)